MESVPWQYLWYFVQGQLQDIVIILWLSVPLVAANVWPVFLGRNAHPIHVDTFGPNKTWAGLVGGIMAGYFTGQFMVVLVSFASNSTAPAEYWGMTPWIRASHILAMTVGVLLGDLLKSYLKRRRGVSAGQPWWPYDQLDAVVGGYFALWVSDQWLTGGQWFSAHVIFGRWFALAILIPVYLGLHRLVSVTGYSWKLKSNPN